MADKPELKGYQGFQDTLKAKAYEWLRQHLHEKPRGKIVKLASFLGIDYKANKQYLWQISSDFKTDVRNRQGLKPPNWHNWLGRIKAFEGLSREEAVKKDWVQTKAKNHYLLFVDPRGLGRLEWHIDGTVKVWVKKPVSDAKKLQLLADAFFNTYLITDIKVFTEWAKTLRQKGEDCAVHVGFDVSYFKIDLFQESNGITIVGGDKSHRDCIEARLRVPEWAEEYREKADFIIQGYKTMIEQISKPLQDLSAPKPKLAQDREMVV
ncbi:MAG: hypothetical protein ABSB28_01525 [Candidatus Bathyarchaeia archaeon]